MESANATVAPRPKRWPVALLVAFFTGCAGAVIIVPVSEWAMKAHHVSNFEGARGYAVACIWLPLGFISGCVAGFTLGLTIKRTGFAGFLLKQGLSIAVIAALIGAIGGLSYAMADHPPLIDGKALALDIEVRVPAKGRSIADLQAQDFTVALVVSASDRHYSDMRWAEATQTDDFITVPAWARLNSRNANREITAGFKDENRQAFNVLLPATPTTIDDAWSEWSPAGARFDGSKPAAEDQYLVRYRVRFDGEYLPTPTPTETPSAEDQTEEPAAEEPSESTDGA